MYKVAFGLAAPFAHIMCYQHVVKTDLKARKFQNLELTLFPTACPSLIPRPIDPSQQKRIRKRQYSRRKAHGKAQIMLLPELRRFARRVEVGAGDAAAVASRRVHT